MDNGQTSTYTPNSLNQYTQHTVPGVINVLGSAQADATVKVTPAGGTPQDVTRQGSLFAKGFTVDNSAGPIPQQLEIDGVKANVGPSGEDAVSSQIRHALVPKTPEQFTYDGDGNLTADARWTYTWDGENRLKGMTAKLETIRGERRPRQLDFAYDAQGRRIEKKVTRSSAIGVALRATYFSSAMLQGSSSSEEIGSLDATIGGPSAQWNGTLQVPTTGSWTLKLYESGSRGYRLWIDGVIRFSAWPTSTGATQQATLNLTAGQDYSVRIDFTGTNGNVQLTWSGPGVTEQDIPSAWAPNMQTTDTIASTHFIYDNWNLLGELDASDSNVRFSYVWGMDLSGSLQGAGGVGGLLYAKLPDTESLSQIAAFDGNGNIAGFVKASNGSISGLYDYNCYGETTRFGGEIAATNHFRFSSKYWDDETDLLYFGRRYYFAKSGRWLTRDAIEERGSLNLMEFAKNNSVNYFDAIGNKLTPYTTDVTSLLFFVEDLEGKALGDHRAFWPQDVAKAVGQKVEISGELAIVLRVQTGLSPDYPGTNGRTIKEHEEVHATISKTFWNSNAELVNRWERSYCSHLCATLAAEIANSQNKVNEYRMRIANQKFDVDDYGRFEAGENIENFKLALSQEEDALQHLTNAFELQHCH